MSNVFNLEQIKNREVLVPITEPGVKRLLKAGARVRFRDDLEGGKSYGGLYLTGGMNNMKGKEAMIEMRNDDRIFIKENNYIYSFEMLEGVYLN